MTDVETYLNEARKSAAGTGSGSALRQLEAHGLPTNKLEDWRYTDLRPFRTKRFKNRFGPLDKTGTALPEPLSSWPKLVLINGHWQPEMSGDLSGTGIEIGSVKSVSCNAHDGIEALNAAFAGPPLQITVNSGPETTGLELMLVFNGAPDQAIHVRNLVRITGGASLDLWIRIVASGPSGWINLANQIEVEADSRVRIFADIEPLGTDFVTISDAIRLASGTRCEYYSISRRAASLRHMIRAELAGPGAGLTINGAALAGRNQTLATVTEVTHSARDASSRQYFRNVAAEKGAASFQGRVVVCEGADGTDAHQSNKNLLIHPSAKARAKPELLIDADDVQCSHGTSTGQLDEAAIFYLRQRGIPLLQARALLTTAFLADIFERMPDQRFGEFCRGLSDPWLAEHLGSEL